MNRALSAAVALGLLLAAPAFADIRGAQCTTSDPYLPGGTATMRWTCSNGSPAAPDPEALDQVALGFPDGWTVACGSQDATDSGGNPVAFSCTASGQTVTYADTDGGPGEILPGRSWSFSVDVTAPATATTPVCAFYTLSGDGSGGEPHDLIDCGTCLPAKGSVTIVKQTVPQDAGGQMFAFAGDLGAFSLTGGQSRTIPNLEPGTYDVTETLPAGWKLTQITCVDPDGGSTFNLATSTASIDVDCGRARHLHLPQHRPGIGDDRQADGPAGRRRSDVRLRGRSRRLLADGGAEQRRFPTWGRAPTTSPRPCRRAGS